MFGSRRDPIGCLIPVANFIGFSDRVDCEGSRLGMLENRPVRLRHKILLALCESMAVSRKIKLASEGFVSHFHNLITKNNFKSLAVKKPRIFGNQMFVRVEEKYSTVLILFAPTMLIALTVTRRLPHTFSQRPR